MWILVLFEDVLALDDNMPILYLSQEYLFC